jgi:hypothetical protein
VYLCGRGKTIKETVMTKGREIYLKILGKNLFPENLICRRNICMKNVGQH